MSELAEHPESAEGVDGVSAVNVDGEVMIFVDVDVSKFTEYTLSGRRIRISGRGADPYERTFGRLTAQTALERRAITVARVGADGTPSAISIVRRRNR